MQNRWQSKKRMFIFQNGSLWSAKTNIHWNRCRDVAIWRLIRCTHLHQLFGRCSKLMNRHIWKEQWNSKLRAMSTPTYLFLLNNVIVPLCIWDSIGDISISSILNNDRYLRLLKRFFKSSRVLLEPSSECQPEARSQSYQRNLVFIKE